MSADFNSLLHGLITATLSNQDVQVTSDADRDEDGSLAFYRVSQLHLKFNLARDSIVQDFFNEKTEMIPLHSSETISTRAMKIIAISGEASDTSPITEVAICKKLVQLIDSDPYLTILKSLWITPSDRAANYNPQALLGLITDHDSRRTFIATPQKAAALLAIPMPPSSYNANVGGAGAGVGAGSGSAASGDKTPFTAGPSKAGKDGQLDNYVVCFSCGCLGHYRNQCPTTHKCASCGKTHATHLCGKFYKMSQFANRLKPKGNTGGGGKGDTLFAMHMTFEDAVDPYVSDDDPEDDLFYHKAPLVPMSFMLPTPPEIVANHVAGADSIGASNGIDASGDDRIGDRLPSGDPVDGDVLETVDITFFTRTSRLVQSYPSVNIPACPNCMF
jgi:hypothetical protein